MTSIKSPIKAVLTSCITGHGPPPLERIGMYIPICDEGMDYFLHIKGENIVT